MGMEHAGGLYRAAMEDRSSYSYTQVPSSIEEAQSYIDGALTGWRAGRMLPFVVRHLATDQVIGSTRFLDLEAFAWPQDVARGSSPTDRNPPAAAEIGSTWYAASAQRTGVNTECKLLLLTHAFEHWGSIRVTLKTDARNTRSRQAIERIGALFEGVRRAHMPAAFGGIRDTAYYSILAEEWPAVKAKLLERA
jgi:RimJ/RimL family protein N-acetyltransferase